MLVAWWVVGRPRLVGRGRTPSAVGAGRAIRARRMRLILMDTSPAPLRPREMGVKWMREGLGDVADARHAIEWAQQVYKNACAGDAAYGC